MYIKDVANYINIVLIHKFYMVCNKNYTFRGVYKKIATSIIV